MEQVRSRRTRNQERLDRGQVGSPKELENLQHELESLARRQSDLEDVELEIMERLEDAQKRRSELQDQRNTLAEKLAAAERARDEEFAAIDRDADDVRARRATAAESLPADLAALYEKLRQQHSGVGAAALHQRRCDGCRIELDAQEVARIAGAPADSVQRCDNCRRILVRTPESGV